MLLITFHIILPEDLEFPGMHSAYIFRESQIYWMIVIYHYSDNHNNHSHRVLSLLETFLWWKVTHKDSTYTMRIDRITYGKEETWVIFNFSAKLWISSLWVKSNPLKLKLRWKRFNILKQFSSFKAVLFYDSTFYPFNTLKVSSVVNKTREKGFVMVCWDRANV